MLLTAGVDHYAIPSLGLEQVKVWLKDCYVQGRGTVPEMCWEMYFPYDGNMSNVLCPLWAQAMLELGLNQDGDPYIGYDEFCDAVYETCGREPRACRTSRTRSGTTSRRRRDGLGSTFVRVFMSPSDK